jgi:hypothetical protein
MTAPVRPCLGCAAYDDHPRHTLITADGAETPFHMDCCAMARNCEVCLAQLAEVGGINKTIKGDELRAYLETTGPEADKPGWTAPAAAPVKTTEPKAA